jgi:hypothetical protein
MTSIASSFDKLYPLLALPRPSSFGVLSHSQVLD